VTSPSSRNIKVVLITQDCFWGKGYGLAARLQELICFLAPRFDLSIAFLGTVSESDIAAMRMMALDFNLCVLGLAPQTPVQALMDNFKQYFNETTPPATYVVVKIELSFMLAAIPGNGRKILDANDLVSARTLSMAEHGVRDAFPLSEAQEVAIFRRYDKVICIQPQEHATVGAWIGAAKTLLAPHPVAAKPQVLREHVASIGLAASGWHANVDGLKWFIERVWPHFHGRNITLDVYGFLCQSFVDCRVPGLRLHGFVDDLDTCYSQIDIAINPVRYGAGLKIKSVEAMAYGLPLVASAQGVSGLEELSGKAFLLAHDENEYIAAIESLLQSPDLRRSLGNHACAHVVDHHSAEQCFRELGELIIANSAAVSAD